MSLAQLDYGSRTPASTADSPVRVREHTVREHTMTREELERDLLSLYEQLLATRLEIIDGAGPEDGSLHLSRGELDGVLVQLDSAIVATRSMVSSTVRAPDESESNLRSGTEHAVASAQPDADPHH